jgi:hypothetical protein
MNDNSYFSKDKKSFKAFPYPLYKNRNREHKCETIKTIKDGSVWPTYPSYASLFFNTHLLYWVHLYELRGIRRGT